eukprot:13572574-Ditylum_brightwellii.AAC.2
MLHSKDDADKVVEELRKRFDITDEGTTVAEYLGVKIDHNKDGSFRIYQPNLMQRIIQTIPGMEKANKQIIPVSMTITLTAGKNKAGRKET